ncbi:MAG TPA: ABC transporter permease [Pyrinomonadaceae bacterium]|nr:ABC transporter permease [Pyrinomonadaceae bacterium]
MDALLQDVRYGFRMLVKHPGFTLAAVLCLALGIGLNTTIFSVVSAMLIRPLPYAEPERVVALHETQIKKGTEWNPLSAQNLADWKEQSQVFDEVAAFQRRSFNFSTEDNPERLAGVRVNSTLFPLLGIRPILGRDFRPEEDKPGGERVVLLGHSLWERRFASSQSVIGKTLLLDGERYTVIGVMPPRFKFPEFAEVWIPLALDLSKTGRGEHFLDAVARLKRGVSVEQAQAELSNVARRLEEQYPETNRDMGAFVRPLRAELVPAGVNVFLLTMLGAVVFVLLIACANVANLLLVRSSARQREIAIRTALGAGRVRVVRQLLTESVMIALVGGGLGILMAFWGLDLVIASVPTEIPFWLSFEIDWRVLIFTFSISVLTGILFGLTPALRLSKPDLQEALKAGGRSATEGARQNRLRSALVISEVALSLVLVIGATLMIRSFLRMQQIDAGFDPENLLTMEFRLSGPGYEEDKQRTAFVQQIAERIKTLPDVEAVGIVNDLPLSDGYSTESFDVEGQTVPPSEAPETTLQTMTPDYLKAVKIPLVRGRAFEERELTESSPVVIVNETMARKFWPNGEAVGKRLRLGAGADAPWLTVVGVTADVKELYRIGGIDVKPAFQTYVLYPQATFRSMTLAVRTRSGSPASITAAVTKEIHGVDKNLPLFNIMTMKEVLERSVWLPLFYGKMFGTFAVLALFLAAVGIYGVMAYSVTQRTHEIGIRMALGAQSSDISKLVLRHGMVLTLIGVAIGLLAAFALTRVLTSLLFGVSATDPLTFAGVSLLLALVALLACYIPARRAMKVDPMVALRYE